MSAPDARLAFPLSNVPPTLGTMRIVTGSRPNGLRPMGGMDCLAAVLLVKESPREAKPVLRTNSTDRDAMLEVFARRFENLSRKELGKLFDKYRLMGRLDIRWDQRAG